MNIVPHEAVGPLRFGESTARDAVTAFGEPVRRRISREDDDELHYAGFVLRFDPANHVLQECTLLPRTPATIDGIDVTWDHAFLRRACERDGSPRDVYGFIVLTALGIAVTGIHDDDASQLAITVFSEGLFDDLMQRSVPFDCSGA